MARYLFVTNQTIDFIMRIILPWTCIIISLLRIFLARHAYKKRKKQELSNHQVCIQTKKSSFIQIERRILLFLFAIILIAMILTW